MIYLLYVTGGFSIGDLSSLWEDRQFTTDYRNWCWNFSVSSIASNHDLSSLCYKRIQHTDNLPLIIGIGVGIPVCLLLVVIMISLLYVTGGFIIQTIYH